ncbi:holin family protein [Microbulbifer sp. OS29]|uniref:Holin family protein n=1 Tax=Microbulbifer okhotskensis TaxID=2926617 RepID=A0A9X2EV49_9GAMM|nr:3TM-type holin [Microbulbifer okhotskensis]MCO1336078.1 holin family protein [Microbulbifer okhotskensis]
MISAISNLFGKVIDKAFPDKTEANRLKAQVDSQLIAMDMAELQSATQVITAEASGESWLQRNWRPVTMLTFVGLIVAHWVGWTAENLSEDQTLALLEIVKVGLGGYVVGRSAEKAAKAWKQS